MTIVTAWLIYCVVIAGTLTVGAAAWERSARWSGGAVRWGWLAALAGSVTLPWLLRLLPERGWAEAVPVAAALRLEPVALTTSGATGPLWSVQDVGAALWVLASAVVLGYVALLLLGLVRARRRWCVAQLEGGPVLMSHAVGPAAVGVRRGMVVLPSWVLELDAELRSLLLRHERAHVEAGDPRLLLGALVLLAAMPWNPVVWLQVVRLRNAIELDCDARVLSTGADPERYGSLLLEVGRRRSRGTFVMATFAEPRVFLEQRIRRIARWPLERRPLRAALFAATAVFLFVAALSCGDPLRVQAPADLPRGEAERPDQVAPAGVTSDAAQPAFTPMTRAPELQNRDEVQAALRAAYPPLLRDAGIGGTASVHFFIDADGVVQNVVISRSSGYPALDAAALNVAAAMRFSPAWNRDEKVAVWLEMPVVFSADPDAGAAKAPADDAERLRRHVERTRAMLDSLERAARTRSLQEREFTPMTQAPELRNHEEVARALVSNYPPLLHDAGIGGRPDVAVFLDEAGAVQNAEIARTSGYPALDQAALAVARLMRFTPAQNRGRAVAVWIEIPIVFTAK
jgi:TonB family protein